MLMWAPDTDGKVNGRTCDAYPACRAVNLTEGNCCPNNNRSLAFSIPSQVFFCGEKRRRCWCFGGGFGQILGHRNNVMVDVLGRNSMD